MIYPIVIYGNEVLRKQCEEIAPDYPEVKKLVEDMFQTLGEAEGVGLAAPQIGKAIRLFIVDCTPWGEDDPECADYKRAFINPEIYAFSEEKKTYNEGCLSFPGIHADVPRSLAIRMRYLDENFVEHDEEFHGLKAWVIQHEYDHIEGVVFTDRISPLRRNLLKGKLLNLAKESTVRPIRPDDSGIVPYRMKKRIPTSGSAFCMCYAGAFVRICTRRRRIPPTGSNGRCQT